MFIEKYKPTTQKSLFHKDIVNHIRKWIKMLEDSFEENKTLKHILFVSGFISCGKTATIELLFKGYNLITVDSDNIRSAEKVSEVMQSIVGFNDITLANIDKWNHKNKKDKQNIVFIDNIELCERDIQSFVDTIHIKGNINVPVILVSNNQKHQDIFSNYNNCTFIQFKKPSLLELSKLIIDINKEELLELDKDNIKKIIESSQYDIRQLFFILEQWSISKNIGIPFTNFIESIQLKQIDRDFYEKMTLLCKGNLNGTGTVSNEREFNLRKIFPLCASEPHVLSSNLYQNYITMDRNILIDQSTSKLDKSDLVHVLNNYSNAMDAISISDIFNNEIYENQQWGLYNDYSFFSTALPSYYLHQNNIVLDKIRVTNQVKENNEFVSFKDISYNFINSYEEVKRICTSNSYNKGLVNTINTSDTIRDPMSLFIITKMLINCIINLNQYFNENKRGKNTTKKEKFDLCNNIKSDSVKNTLDILVKTIYYYKLFEIDTEDILNISKYESEETLKQNVNKIDLRVFKRLLNIFTFDDSHKVFKSNVEISIQYKLFQMLIEDLKKKKQTNSIDNIEELSQDLDKIWNL